MLLEFYFYSGSDGEMMIDFKNLLLVFEKACFIGESGSTIFVMSLIAFVYNLDSWYLGISYPPVVLPYLSIFL